MKYHKLIQILFFILFLATLVWDGYLYTLPTHETNFNYLYNAMYGMLYLIGGAIAISYGLKTSLKSNVGKMLFFFGLGLWCYEAGLIIWVYYNFVLKVGIPFPSLADIFFVLFYPVMGIACYNVIRLYKSLLSKAVLRDSIIIMIVSLLAVFFFFEKPDLSVHLGVIEKIINVLYPGGDGVLVSMVLIGLRVGGGKIHPSLYFLFAGLMIQASADFLFVFRTASGTYWNGDISDFLYTCSGFIISFGLFEAINSLNNIFVKHPLDPTALVKPATPVNPTDQTSVPAPQTPSQPSSPTPEPKPAETPPPPPDNQPPAPQPPTEPKENI